MKSINYVYVFGLGISRVKLMTTHLKNSRASHVTAFGVVFRDVKSLLEE